jgi:hypothetical protein
MPLRPDQRDAVLADRHRRLRAPLYYENAHATPPTEPTTTPTGLAAFGGDFSGIRWSVFDHGGHFAAHKVPDLLVGDVRRFFRRFR